MKSIVALLFVTLIGCTASREVETPTDQPALLRMAPLPPLPSVSSLGGVQLSVLFHIMQDGSVQEVRTLGSSGDSQWDSLACQAMKKWRFAAPGRNHVRSDLWVRQMIVVQVQTQEPIVMTLGELACSSQREADSLYTLIRNGAGFDSLVKQALGISTSEQSGMYEPVDIAMYPRRIREELQNLRTDEITRPIRVGNRYVIYKRFKDSNSSGL